MLIPAGQTVASGIEELQPLTDAKLDPANELLIYYGAPKSGSPSTSEAQSLPGLYAGEGYGHGIEHMSASIVNEDDVEKLCFRKITGDPNVPAGRVTIITASVPKLGGPPVEAFVQSRSDIDDEQGTLPFGWCGLGEAGSDSVTDGSHAHPEGKQ